MSLTELLKDPAFRTIVDRFVAQIPDRVRELRAAIDGRRFEDARLLAHQLKGAGGSFGFPSITREAGRIETYCASGEASREFAGSVDRFEIVCEQVIAEWSATTVTA